MNPKQKLGRGFDALIPKNLDPSLLEDSSDRVQRLLISDITPNPAQPRSQFDTTAHSELVASIGRHGVLQPIIVVRANDRKGYRIVAGERRWRAARDAKLNKIPAIVRSLKELEEVELALIENIQRVDLSPLEQAMSVFKLQRQFNLALDEIAKKLGKAPSTISNLARLLQLPETARQALASGKINEGHARAILALKSNPSKQEELLNSILNNGWTVRQAEQFVLAVKKTPGNVSVSQSAAAEEAISRGIGHALKTTANIKRTAKGGQIIIHFKTEEDLARIADKLKS